MPTIDVDTARIAFRVDGAGPGLVLVHGTGGNAETNWSQMVAPLAKSRTVVRPDYAGSGDTTDDGGPLTIAGLASQVVAAARQAGTSPFDLVGFSLGAVIAVHIAADYPDLVRSVVLLGGFVSGNDARQTLQFDLWRDLIHADRAMMARFLLLTGFSPDFLSAMGPAAIDRAADEIVAHNNWEGMLRQIDLDMTLDVRDQAQRIVKPTLVIGCTFDTMVPPAHARELAALIPGALYREMATGHLAPLEKPDELARLLIDFLHGDFDR